MCFKISTVSAHFRFSGRLFQIVKRPVPEDLWESINCVYEWMKSLSPGNTVWLSSFLKEITTVIIVDISLKDILYKVAILIPHFHCSKRKGIGCALFWLCSQDTGWEQQAVCQGNHSTLTWLFKWRSETKPFLPCPTHSYHPNTDLYGQTFIHTPALRLESTAELQSEARLHFKGHLEWYGSI